MLIINNTLETASVSCSKEIADPVSSIRRSAFGKRVPARAVRTPFFIKIAVNS